MFRRPNQKRPPVGGRSQSFMGRWASGLNQPTDNQPPCSQHGRGFKSPSPRYRVFDVAPGVMAISEGYPAGGHPSISIGLHIAHYNLCRVHETLRVTPAMQVGVTDHIWTLGELVEAATSTEKRPPAPETPKPTPYVVRGTGLRVIKGGRG